MRAVEYVFNALFWCTLLAIPLLGFLVALTTLTSWRVAAGFLLVVNLFAILVAISASSPSAGFGGAMFGGIIVAGVWGATFWSVVVGLWLWNRTRKTG